MLTREEETPEVPKIEGSYMAFVEKSYNEVFDVEIDEGWYIFNDEDMTVNGPYLTKQEAEIILKGDV